MTDQWDRFAASADQTLNALGFEDNVDLFEPTESYTAGEGYGISYPSSPTETVSGEVQPPEADAATDRGGVTRDADLLVYTPEDITTDLTDGGESGEALARVEVSQTDETYEVQAVEPQFDGWQLLELSEVDT